MVFSSAIFLFLFLPVTFLLNLLVSLNGKVKKIGSNALLVMASLVFYAWGEPVLVLLMVASILVNGCCGMLIAKAGGIWKKVALTAGIAADLSILGYYKYAGFLASLVNGLFGKAVLPVVTIALPIGISFFTFQAISYVIDVYRGDTKASFNLIHVALYISFFPQLIAGPIVKYREIHEQIEDRKMEWRGVADGFRRFTYGLGKKVLIANVLGLCVDKIFALDIALVDTRAAWIGALAYALQIYYDFSGYSDMAIGLGKMFGFTIPENFTYPYLSKSISEFWRRWHISLGSWFREYLYIPLGGNRKGTMRTYLDLGIVFLLTGLWHGADISFVLWGLYHGLFVILERLGFQKVLSKSKVLSVLYVNLVVVLGWVLFRADNTILGLQYLARMLMPWRYSRGVLKTAFAGMKPLGTWNYMDPKTIVVFVFGLLGVGFLSLLPARIKERWQGSLLEAFYCTAILGLSIAAIASNTYNPFIYFQF